MDDSAISHGVCRVCCEEHLKRWHDRHLGQYLDSFDEPVVVTTGVGGEILAANQGAADAFRKHDREFYGLLGAETDECVNWRRSEGCGPALSCWLCAIRHAVACALETGEEHVGTPATRSAGLTTIDYLVAARPLASGIIEVRLEALSEAALAANMQAC